MAQPNLKIVTNSDPVYKSSIDGFWYWLIPGTNHEVGPFTTQQLAHKDLKEYQDNEG